MKKFLSTVLALVMVMSLVTVGAVAKDFTDNSEIDYTEAVDVISEIGVVDGYTDDSFQPGNNLTRGAAAKIICNLILGPTTADALRADTAPYSDVAADSTFAGYISYCQQQGIISGYADGTFRAGGALTGYAFMKMLLGALGYDSAIEGYSGNNWSVNVGKTALGIGLHADYVGSFDGTKAVTREEACLFAFNTLQATMVEYDTNLTVSQGELSVTAASRAKDVVRAAGTDYTGTPESSDVKDSCGTMQFCERFFSDLRSEDATDDFGRPASQWRFDGSSVGTYANSADDILPIADEGKDLVELVTDSAYLNADVATGGAAVYYNGMEVGNYSAAAVRTSKALVGKGDILEVFENDDNDVDTIVIRSYTYAKIDSVDSELSSILQNRGASREIELVDVDGIGIGTYYDDHDDDEKVLRGFSASAYTAGAVLAVAVGEDGAILDSYIAETATGTPTAARDVTVCDYTYANGYQGTGKGVSNGSITLGDTRYSYAAQFTGLPAGNTVDFDEVCTVYLTAEGYALAITGDGTNYLSHVYYVTGVYGETNRGQTRHYAQAVAVGDGAEEHLLLTLASASALGASGMDFVSTASGLYIMTEDDGEYSAEAYRGQDGYGVVEVDATQRTGNMSPVTIPPALSFTAAHDWFNGVEATKKHNRLYSNDDSFFVGVEKNSSDIEITTAIEFKSLDPDNCVGLKVYIIYSKSGYCVNVVYAGDTLASAVNRDDIVYLSGTATTKNADGWEGNVSFMEDMSAADITIANNSVQSGSPARVRQGFYTYSLNNGIYTLKNNNLEKITAMTRSTDGVLEGVVFTEMRNNVISGSTDDVDFDAVSAGEATVIDTRSTGDKRADAYSNDIDSVARLTAALNSHSVTAVTADVFVEDGDILFLAVVAVNDAEASADAASDNYSAHLDGTNVMLTAYIGTNVVQQAAYVESWLTANVSPVLSSQAETDTTYVFQTADTDYRWDSATVQNAIKIRLDSQNLLAPVGTRLDELGVDESSMVSVQGDFVPADITLSTEDDGLVFRSGYYALTVTGTVSETGSDNCTGSELAVAAAETQSLFVHSNEQVALTVTVNEAIRNAGVTFSSNVGTVTSGAVTGAVESGVLNVVVTLGTVDRPVTITLTATDNAQ